MPLRIIHQDITAMECDAIVNPTDSCFSGSGGTDLAVHRAAGPELAEECRTLGWLQPSEVAVTGAYGLPCRWILHTVGPRWHGGSRNEEALLRACYLNALFKAVKLGAKSVAFPLISAGTFGVPRDRVLRIAQTAIGDFLSQQDPETEVFICIRNPRAYELCSEPELERFLRVRGVEAADVSYCMAEELPPEQGAFECREASACQEPRICGSASFSLKRGSPVEAREERAESMPAPTASAPEDLADWISHQDDPFKKTLLELIKKKGMTEVQCYKKANISKKTFWKINNEAGYKPSKPTVIAFAIALELTLQETENLLRTVGFSLSHSNTFDMIIEFYIRRGEYDIFEINAALYKYDQSCLGC